MKSSCSLVLGGHVNGYSIVRELREESSADVIVFDYGRSIARYSNKVTEVHSIERSSKSLLLKIKELRKRYAKIIIFPTDDIQLEWLHELQPQLKEFCYLPFNQANLKMSLDKFYQYEVCEKLGVPFPYSKKIVNSDDLEFIKDFTFPIILKPSTRKDLQLNVFRTLTLNDINDFKAQKLKLSSFLEEGVEFVASELIPGDDTNIYAYTCFRSNDGEVLNEWAGKKLTQYPNEFGIFSSASNEFPDIVTQLGRTLVAGLDCYGIVEPEFKYDRRDGRYKLMEVNLRSMMWHRVGSLSGVKLHQCQYDYATGRTVKQYIQDTQELHYVLMLHEIPNLIARRGYLKHFIHNIFGSNTRYWAIFDIRDIKPFFASLILLVKGVSKACQSRFFQK